MDSPDIHVNTGHSRTQRPLVDRAATSGHNGQSGRLSAAHRRQLEDSGISSEVAAERATFSARRGKEVPQDYGQLPKRPGMIFPIHTLDGSLFYRLRPNSPGRGPKYVQPKGMPNRLDVHPRQHERIKRRGGMRYITEGEKKTDAGVSHGMLMVGLSGVYNGQKDRKLIPDWDYLPLEGESYSITFDSDIRENPNVQMAADRMAGLLEARGAKVFMTLLPPGPNGEKQGLDDFLAAGGTVKELEMMTRPYASVDIGEVRLSQSDKLRTAYENLLTSWWGEDWNRIIGTGEKPHWMRGHTVRDVELSLVDHARRRGKVRDDGTLDLEVEVSTRTLSLDSAKSRPAVSRSLRHLEAEGRIRIETPEDPKKPRTYVLLAKPLAKPAGRADCYHDGEREAEREKATGTLQVCASRGNTLRAPDVPRLRWSAPAQKPRKVIVSHTPRTTMGTIGKERARIERLGPRLGRVLDHLEAGGPATDEEIARFLKCERVRDVRRRVLDPLVEAGLIVPPAAEGGAYQLTADWREKLQEEREDKLETAAEKRDRRRYREESEHFRKYGPYPPPQKPPSRLMGPEKVAGIVAEREKEAEEARIEYQRQKVGTTAEVFVHDKLQVLGRIRLALLMEVYQDAGGDPWDIPPALRRMGCRVERLPEYGDRQFVFPPVNRRAA